MKCEDYQTIIEEYVDGTLDQKDTARLNAHTADCAECANFYRELSQEQEVYSRYQRDVEVTPMLWSSIEARIKQERPSRPVGLLSRLREQFAGAFSAPRLSPAFAVVLVVLAIGVTVVVMSRLNSPNSSQIAGNDTQNRQPIKPGEKSDQSTPTTQPPAVAPQNNLADGTSNEGRQTPKISPPRPRVVAATTLTPTQLVREAEQKYLTAIAMLSRDVNRRRSQLDPMMLARFDASLSEIDRTIRETKQVVKINPDDPIALQYLLAAYSKKVEVLREMTND